MKISPSGRETNPAKNLHTFPASADTIHVFQSDTIYSPRPGAADTGGIENESNRNRAPHRRPGARRYSQGDPPHHAYPRGRPVIDDIGTMGAVLRRDGGVGEENGARYIAGREYCAAHLPHLTEPLEGGMLKEPAPPAKPEQEDDLCPSDYHPSGRRTG